MCYSCRTLLWRLKVSALRLDEGYGLDLCVVYGKGATEARLTDWCTSEPRRM
jgi:hypothetical protein